MLSFSAMWNLRRRRRFRAEPIQIAVGRGARPVTFSKRHFSLGTKDLSTGAGVRRDFRAPSRQRIEEAILRSIRFELACQSPSEINYQDWSPCHAKAPNLPLGAPRTANQVRGVNSGQNSNDCSASQTCKSRVPTSFGCRISCLAPVQFPGKPVPEDCDPEEERYIIGAYPNQREIAVPRIERIAVASPWVGQDQSRKIDSSRDHTNRRRAVLKRVLDVIHCTVALRRLAVLVGLVNVACHCHDQLPERQQPSPSTRIHIRCAIFAIE
jgi:hypothetical protein